MPKSDSGKSTQNFIGKLLKFSGNQGEDREKLEKNWPFPEPKLNNMEAHRYCECKAQGIKQIGDKWFCKSCQKEISPEELALFPDNCA